MGIKSLLELKLSEKNSSSKEDKEVVWELAIRDKTKLKNKLIYFFMVNIMFEHKCTKCYLELKV